MATGSKLAIEKENVLIRAANCSLAILLQLGGNIASLRVNDRELLQAPLVPYGPWTSRRRRDRGPACWLPANPIPGPWLLISNPFRV